MKPWAFLLCFSFQRLRQRHRYTRGKHYFTLLYKADVAIFHKYYYWQHEGYYIKQVKRSVVSVVLLNSSRVCLVHWQIMSQIKGGGFGVFSLQLDDKSPNTWLKYSHFVIKFREFVSSNDWPCLSCCFSIIIWDFFFFYQSHTLAHSACTSNQLYTYYTALLIFESECLNLIGLKVLINLIPFILMHSLFYIVTNNSHDLV